MMRTLRRGGEPVLVETYSATRADERPRLVLWNLQRHEVAEILSRDLIEPVDQPGNRRSRFLVRTARGLVLRLEHTLLTDRWRVTAAFEVTDTPTRPSEVP